MSSPTLRIVFMGTPEFAVPALNAIHERGHEVAMVVTQPDRPKGRGRQLTPPPVKKAALALGRPVFQPEKIRASENVATLASLAPDILVVVAYGQILPPAVLEIPRIAPINIHASLLPKYRGPAPIQWAVINRERETGVTTMVMDSGVDTGDMLMSAATPISDTDTAQTLHNRLARIGGAIIVDTLDGLARGTLTPRPQDPDQATQAPMLKKSDGVVNWDRPAVDIDARVRGLTPWPGAFAVVADKRVKLLEAVAVPMHEHAAPGTVLQRFDDELVVAAGEGALSIKRLQGPSGKRLDIADFLRGQPVPPGTVLP